MRHEHYGPHIARLASRNRNVESADNSKEPASSRVFDRSIGARLRLVGYNDGPSNLERSLALDSQAKPMCTMGYA